MKRKLIENTLSFENVLKRVLKLSIFDSHTLCDKMEWKLSSKVKRAECTQQMTKHLTRHKNDPIKLKRIYDEAIDIVNEIKERKELERKRMRMITERHAEVEEENKKVRQFFLDEWKEYTRLGRSLPLPLIVEFPRGRRWDIDPEKGNSYTVSLYDYSKNLMFGNLICAATDYSCLTVKVIKSHTVKNAERLCSGTRTIIPYEFEIPVGQILKLKLEEMNENIIHKIPTEEDRPHGWKTHLNLNWKCKSDYGRIYLSNVHWVLMNTLNQNLPFDLMRSVLNYVEFDPGHFHSGCLDLTIYNYTGNRDSRKPPRKYLDIEFPLCGL